MAGGPGEEIAYLAGGGAGGQPGVGVGLGALGQGAVVGVQPGEELGGGADVASGVAGVAAWPGGAFGADSQSAHHLPGGVAAQLPLCGLGGDGVQDVVEPLFGAGEFFIAGREYVGGGEHVTQEVRGPAPRVGIEGLVGGR